MSTDHHTPPPARWCPLPRDLGGRNNNRSTWAVFTHLEVVVDIQYIGSIWRVSRDPRELAGSINAYIVYGNAMQ